jgi:hypothetical protein
MKLSKQDAGLLVTLYETEEYSAVVRMLEARKIDLAVSAVQATDFETVCRIQGRVSEIDWVINQIHEVYKKGNK